MKKAILTSGFLLFMFGNIFSQIIGAISLTTSVTVATACVAPCDGTASVKASGGTPPYTYNWSSIPTQTTPTATGLCPGNYTVLVNDANAGIPNYATATVTITCSGGSVGNLVLTPSSTPANKCVAPCDGSASVNVTGGTPAYTYSWTTIPVQTTQNATGLCPGTYTVLVRDAVTPVPNTAYATVTVSCSGISSGVLTVTTSATVATACTAPCNGTATANPTGGTPPYFYMWNTTPVQTTQTATGLCPGTYTVTVFDSANPSAMGKGSATVICSTANGINTIFEDMSIQLFPNPAHSDLNLQFNSESGAKVEISIRGILGTEIMSDAFAVKGNYSRVIDISSLPMGIYSIEFSSENSMITKKFIKH